MALRHHSFPAPVLNSSHLSTSQSKSTVLAGVQDAYWSDDDAEDNDCPLCAEEMDISDLNFKPCPCGYQLCRFCWNHIKQNLNGRCPACRRPYTDEAVQFKPINKEDHKRLTQMKKQRDRERKDIDALGRRHLLNVRIVQRNVVYVVGLGSRYAKEELIPTLRSNEYFGQYGKISKILLVKRTPPGGREPIVGLYVTYYRREDAARAIAAVDGTASPSGGGDVMRASYGTTKYCTAFLRGVSCTNNGCTDLHDWGDEKDCFTKEDLATLKHAIKDTENRQKPSTLGRKPEEHENQLPRSSGWGKSGNTSTSATVSSQSRRDNAQRGVRRGHRPTQSNSLNGDGNRSQTTPSRSYQERKTLATKTPSQASSSRPSTPAVPHALPQRPTTPAASTTSSKPSKGRRGSIPPAPPLPPRSPTSSVAVESDFGSGSQDAVSSASPVLSPPQTHAIPNSTPVPSVPPGLTPPPGLKAPPGIPVPASSPLARDPSSGSYTMSTQVQALLEDVRARRETTVSTNAFSPFPELDQTLQALSLNDGNGGGFNFNLDPNLASDDASLDAGLPEFPGTDTPFNNVFDPFSSTPSNRIVPPQNSFGPPPGLVTAPSNRPLYDFSLRPISMERQVSNSSAYTGSFNPFSDGNDDATQNTVRRSGQNDEDFGRRVSRFGFARERQGSGISATSSPMLSADGSLSEHSPSTSSAHVPWQFQRQHDFGPPPGLPLRTSTPGSRNSPLASYASPQTSFAHQTSRFQSFNMNQNDSPNKDINSTIRGRTLLDGHQSAPTSSQPSQHFYDPAIMTSVPYGVSGLAFQQASMTRDGSVSRMHFGRPSGLVQPDALPSSNSVSPALLASAPLSQTTSMLSQVSSMGGSSIPVHFDQHVTSPSASTLEVAQTSPVLSPADFPALPTTNPETHSKPSPHPHIQSIVKDAKLDKLDRKAKKKALVAERAAEKERIAQEKAGEEKERLMKEKAAEKARVTKEKAEKERLAQEKAEKERLIKEKAEKEKPKMVEKHATKSVPVATQGKGKQGKSKPAANEPATASPIHNDGQPKRGQTSKVAAAATAESDSPMPILSKMPKKNKPVTKPIKIPRDDDHHHADTASSLASAVTANSETTQLPTVKLPNVSEVDHNIVVNGVENGKLDMRNGHHTLEPKSLTELLRQIQVVDNGISIENHPFFDPHKINAASKVPIDYNTMVKALSAFPVSGASYNNYPATSLNDNTVSSFQQLLETLTQTMSDLVQLLPQSTWGSIFDVLSQDLKDLKREYSLHRSTSFDGLMQDDLPDDVDDDVYEADPPTPTMDKRARWMEVQLAKLEELHRDVNSAAITAILTNNDHGWDPAGFLPRLGNTRARFEQLGHVSENGTMRPMTVEELEKKLVVAKEAAVFAETELRESIEALQALRPGTPDEV